MFSKQILASDGGLPSRNSTCQVIIEIIEGISENVHEPICKNIQMYISENEKAGFLVTVIQATDKDNDVLWYDIIGIYLSYLIFVKDRLKQNDEQLLYMNNLQYCSKK